MIESSKKLIDEVINYINRLDRVSAIPVIEAPTGYGKSVSAPIIAYISNEKGFSYNLIHVLPLRAIVEDLYVCKYLYALGRNVPACRAEPPKPFYEALRSMGVSENDVAYQMGFDYMLRGVGIKSPTYDAKIVISTLDSFALNFLRIPVNEVYREIKHYAIPRTRIFTSTVFLDEAHMINRFDDESSGKMLAFLKLLIEFSLTTETPLIVASATLWSGFREKVASWSSNRAVFFTICREDGKNGHRICVRDREFENHAKSIKWHTQVIEESELVSKVMEHVERGGKVLVVRDRIEDAVELYSKLDLNESEKVLIHGRLCLEDREKALDASRRAKVVVATPIVEAGVDWDFDAGFRDATNIPSAVQVFGRVCRARHDCEGSVYLIKPSKAPNELAYTDAVKLVSFVKSHSNIDWRIPYSYSSDRGEEVKGYQELLELSSAMLREDQEAENMFRWLVTPVTIPSDYIDIIMSEYGRYGSILRSPLAQFYVYGMKRLYDAKSVQDVISGLISYSYDLLNLFRSCVEGVACVVQIDETIVSKCSAELRYVTGLQRECAEFFSRVGKERGKQIRPVFVGYVFREECYRRGIGLVRRQAYVLRV